MRIKKSKSKNSVSYSIVKDYTNNGKRSTKIVDKIGNIKYVTSLAEAQGITIEQWLDNYLNEYIKQHAEETDKIIIEKHIGKIIPKNQKNTFNIGHLFLKDIYYDLKLNEICEHIENKYRFKFNLNDNIKVILRIIKGRWKIEESFRIMKSDFKSRLVNLSRKDRITAHFLTCYLSLLIYRILEKKLNYNYTTSQILDTLRNMYVSELKGNGYIPAYERTDLTDELHEVFEFRTDYEIMNYKYFEKIFNKITKAK